MSDYDEDDDQTQEDADSDQEQADTQGAHQALADAAPEEVDAHRGLLGEALQMLQGQGVDTAGLAARAGAGTDDPEQMSHGDLVNTTLALARQHPEVMSMVAERFPEAQGLLGSVLGGGGASAGGGGLLGGLLGRL